MTIRQVTRQAMQSSLRRRIGRLPHGRMQRGVTRYKNHMPTPFCQHTRHNCRRTQRRRLEIHGKNIIPLLFFHPRKRNITDDSRATDQEVTRIRLKKPCHCFPVQQIQIAPTKCDHLPAFSSKLKGDSLTQTPRPTSDDHTFQPRHVLHEQAVNKAPKTCDLHPISISDTRITVSYDPTAVHYHKVILRVEPFTPKRGTHIPASYEHDYD